MRRIALLCVIAVVADVTAWLLWSVHRNRRIERAFVELPLGTTRAEVARRLGKPLDLSECVASFNVELACSHEMIYPYAFAPYLPQYWVFVFDDNGG